MCEFVLFIRGWCVSPAPSYVTVCFVATVLYPQLVDTSSTTSVFSVVGVTTTDDTLVLSGVPYLANVGRLFSVQRLSDVHVPSSSYLLLCFVCLFLLVSLFELLLVSTSVVSLLTSTY